jgi:hypothetical protein
VVVVQHHQLPGVSEQVEPVFIMEVLERQDHQVIMVVVVVALQGHKQLVALEMRAPQAEEVIFWVAREVLVIPVVELVLLVLLQVVVAVVPGEIVVVLLVVMVQ